MTKPASGATLDTGNALYTNLAAVWALLEGSGTTSADSKGSRTLTLSSSGLWATNGSGENIIHIASATASPLALASALALVGTGGGGSDWSIAFRAKQAASDTAGMVLGDNTVTTDFVWMDGGSFLRLRDSLNADADFSGVTTFTTTANYVLTWEKATGKARLYKNGTEVNAGGIVSGTGALNITTLGNGYTSTTLALVGDIEYVYVWNGRLLTITEAGTLNSSPYGMFGAASAVITEQNLPANHNGNITVHVVGTGTAFTSSTTWTPSGVAGWSVASKTQVDGTHYTVVLTPPAAATPPAGATGTLTLTEGVTGSTAPTTTVGTPSFTRSPTSGATGTTPTLTLTGTNTIWSTETAAGLFTVSGGTGASLATPTVSTDTAATDVLTVGSAAGTLTITDSSTGATATFTATAGTIAITTPVQYQWKRGGGSAATFTVSGTYTGSVTHVEVSSDGSTWATLDSSPSAGAYTGTISLAASETDYTVSVRFSNATSVTASVANVAVIQRVIALGGQSNEAGRGTNNQTAHSVFGSDAHRMKPSSGYAVLADPTGTDGSGTGSYAVHELNVLGAALGYRLGLCNFAVGGTSITDWLKGAGTGYYEALAAAVTAAGGVDILRMGPCETDAIAGMSQATYHADMVTFVASWLADFAGTKILWRTLQHIDTGSATQPHQDNINAAILAAAGGTPGQATGDIAGVYLVEVRSLPAFPGDTFHWKTDQQLADIGGIMAAADYAALNPTGGGGATLFIPVE